MIIHFISIVCTLFTNNYNAVKKNPTSILTIYGRACPYLLHLRSQHLSSTNKRHIFNDFGLISLFDWVGEKPLKTTGLLRPYPVIIII
jgi:hypothetical protein